MSNTSSTTVTAHHRSPDRECRARACAYLVELIGFRPGTLTWDSTHCLQGHLQLGRCELIVIAPRDASHQPVVLSAPSWEAIRRSAGDRRELIESCAITNGVRLAAVLDCGELSSCGVLAA